MRWRSIPAAVLRPVHCGGCATTSILISTKISASRCWLKRQACQSIISRAYSRMRSVCAAAWLFAAAARRTRPRNARQYRTAVVQRRPCRGICRSEPFGQALPPLPGRVAESRTKEPELRAWGSSGATSSAYAANPSNVASDASKTGGALDLDGKGDPQDQLDREITIPAPAPIGRSASARPRQLSPRTSPRLLGLALTGGCPSFLHERLPPSHTRCFR